MKARGDIKMCSTCRMDLPLSEFYRHRGHPDGLHHQCKACQRKRPPRTGTSRTAAARREYNRRHFDRVRGLLYGLAPGEYDEMLARQNGVCAICGRPPTTRALAVDHCHTTSRIRGLLCSACNRGIGLLGDTAESVAVALRYLS